jgi:hypothetical protein
MEQYEALELKEQEAKDQIYAVKLAKVKALNEKAYFDALKQPEQEKKRLAAAMDYQNENMRCEIHHLKYNIPAVKNANRKALEKSFIEALSTKEQKDERLAASRAYQHENMKTDVDWEARHNDTIKTQSDKAIEKSYIEALKSAEMKKARLQAAKEKQKSEIEKENKGPKYYYC